MDTDRDDLMPHICEVSSRSSSGGSSGVGQTRCAASVLIALVFLAIAQTACAGGAAAGDDHRKAIVMGRMAAPGETDGFRTHAQRARMTFLRLVGNLDNDPARGWTCEMEWDVKVRLGLNPTNTSSEALFNYIGQHHLGYRIAMNCGPGGQGLAYWDSAVANGILPFAPPCLFTDGRDAIGLRAAVGVAGGVTVNVGQSAPSIEFFEAVPDWATPPTYEDTAQSWANQGLAAKFARLLDAHPEYNIWDGREHLRQAGSFWAGGWTEANGYGRVNERAVVGKLLPGPPVNFLVLKSHHRDKVGFSWCNFRQSDFAATVIARGDGRVIYEGAGTNLIWTSDVDGDETFRYWSKNRAGEISRMESYQRRTVTGLSCRINQTCLVLGARAGEELLARDLCQRFEQVAPNWVCETVSRSGIATLDPHTGLPNGPLVAVLPDFPAMVSYAISNRYRLILAPVVYPERDLYGYKSEWDRATAAGVLVVLPHHNTLSISRDPKARRLSPPRLFSAVTVGVGTLTNRLSFGPGLEFFDSPAPRGPGVMTQATQMDAAGVVAGKLAQVLDANPRYNLWDARQHLRQSASNYRTGWIEDGGYGRPPEQPAKIVELDLAPPLEIQAARSAGGDSVGFSWQNFLQTGFAETVIQRQNGRTIYHGAGTNYVWRSDVNGEEVFRFFTRDKAGRLSRPEAYTVVRVENLHRSQ
jgi:hypothetical protein